jgi:hypothetical protein
MNAMQWLFASGAFALAVCFLTLLIAVGGWKLFWELVNFLGTGAVAVNILHFHEAPSYLVLTIGWGALIASLVSLGTVLNALFGYGSNECVCAICTRHRAEIAAGHGKAAA